MACFQKFYLVAISFPIVSHNFGKSAKILLFRFSQVVQGPARNDSRPTCSTPDA